MNHLKEDNQFIDEGASMTFSKNEIDLGKIIRDPQFLTNIYDVVRIVDPVLNQVLYNEASDKLIGVTKGTCYSLWEKGTCCENCITLRAYEEKNSVMKFEATCDKIYLITAVPMMYQGKVYVVEMIKDITGKGIVESLSGNNLDDMVGFVKHHNDLLVRDELTAVFNRRFINMRLPTEIKRSEATGSPSAILMIDLDGFKNINDSYGHVAGDCILQHVAGLLHEGVRGEHDWVARYGGDEFLIYLHGATMERALAVAKRMKHSVEYGKIKYREVEIRVTCSIGIGLLENGMEPQQWIEGADRNLYLEKSEIDVPYVKESKFWQSKRSCLTQGRDKKLTEMAYFGGKRCD